MEININDYRNENSGGGSDALCQNGSLMLLVEGMVKSCKAMSSYEQACTVLMELVPIVANNQAAMNALIRGKEEVREFFEKRNTPQPSNLFEGCNVFTGNTQAERFVGKDFEIDVTSPGNQIISQQSNYNNKEKE